jgi:hypothetical protein
MRGTPSRATRAHLSTGECPMVKIKGRMMHHINGWGGSIFAMDFDDNFLCRRTILAHKIIIIY